MMKKMIQEQPVSRGKRGPARRSGRVSRADIAVMANVSLATVTYALNPSPNSRISEATSRKVCRIAEKMGYRPDFVHRSMSAGRTFAIGLILPESRSLMFPFYELMIEGLLKAMNRDDYDPLFLIRPHWERVENVVHQGRVDGLVMVQSDLGDQYIRQAVAMGVPVVVMNRDLAPDIQNGRVACVCSDHKGFMQEVVKELVGLGCRRLLYFSDIKSTFADQENAFAFEAELTRHAGSGVTGRILEPVWDAFAPHVDHIFEGGGRWDGILVNGGAIAAEVVRVAESKGLVPGRDYQLITRDAYPEKHVYQKRVPLNRRERAVYLQQPFRIGEEAWALMAGLLGGTPPRVPVVRIPYRREEPGNG